VTLAHRGVLFLDELGEFSPLVLDALRQPLEERVVRISRQGAAVAFPADFLLVACSNPCPCGLGPPRCICSESHRLRYRRRLSAPLIDRFDLRVALGPAAPDEPAGAPSQPMRDRVMEAVARQRRRYRNFPWRRNAGIPAGALRRAVPLGADAEDALRQAAYRREWSGRGLACTHRVARTLADLAGVDAVSVEHVLLAAGLREEVL
jgi:magnesium chelatase family protein